MIIIKAFLIMFIVGLILVPYVFTCFFGGWFGAEFLGWLIKSAYDKIKKEFY